MGLHPSASQLAIALICLLYGIAAAVNLCIPDTGVRYAQPNLGPRDLLSGFAFCVRTLWRDRLGQISLAVTTLFWGAGATLQLLVISWCPCDPMAQRPRRQVLDHPGLVRLQSWDSRADSPRGLRASDSCT